MLVSRMLIETRGKTNESECVYPFVSFGARRGVVIILAHLRSSSHHLRIIFASYVCSFANPSSPFFGGTQITIDG